jgi:hypothetical protein
MDCPKCGKEMEMNVSLRFRMPARYANAVSKKVLRKKEVVITAALWDGATVTCYDCGYREKGI